MPVFFNGAQLVTPVVATKVDDSRMYQSRPQVGNAVVLIGRSEGGEPKKAIRITSPAHAKALLRSGDLLDAARRALAPSAETGGPSELYIVRVNPAVQSTLTLQDGAAADAISLASTGYGAYTKRIRVKVEAGTSSGKRVTLQLDDGYYSRDNIARNALKVRYTGSEVTGTISVTPTSVVLEAPTGANTVTIDLNDYKTVQELVDRIAAETDWTASVSAGAATTPALYGLDGATDADAKSSELTLTANLQAIIDWINSSGEGFVNATRPAAADAVPANIDWTYLTGGSDGTIDNDDWNDCFTELEGVDAQWVVPLSDSASIWAMADAHCIYMSSVGRMERRAFVGGSTSVNIAQAKVDAAGLDSDRTAYVFPSITDYDDNGDLVTYPAYIAAAMVAGGFGGMTPGNSMTNKTLSVVGVATTLKAPGDTDGLIENGVLCLYPRRGSIRVAKAVSTVNTALADERYNRVEVSTGAAVDFTVRSVREALEPYIGRKANATTRVQIARVVTGVLDILAEPEPAGLAVLAGDEDNPAYLEPNVVVNGDVIEVSFQCSPVIPTNYILVTVHAVPYSTGVAA